MHDAISLGLPLVAIFGGFLLSRADTKGLRAEMNRRFDKVDARFDVLEAGLRYFHGVTGKLDGRVQALGMK